VIDELELRYGHPLLVVFGVNRLVIQLLYHWCVYNQEMLPI